MQKMAQSSSWDAASFQPAIGATFCVPISRLMSAKEVKVPPTKIAYHYRVRSATSDAAEGERSGNQNIFRASLIPSGPLVWKASAITMTAAAWWIHGDWKCRLSAVRRQATSIAALAWYFLSGATVLHMSWSCDDVLALQIQRRLLISTLHCSIRVTACLMGADGGAGSCIWKS